MKKDKTIDLMFQSNEDIEDNNKLNITEEFCSSKIDMLKIIKRTSTMEISSQLSFEDLLKNDLNPDVEILKYIENKNILSLEDSIQVLNSKDTTLEKILITSSHNIKTENAEINSFKVFINKDVSLYVEDTIVLEDLQQMQERQI